MKKFVCQDEKGGPVSGDKKLEGQGGYGVVVELQESDSQTRIEWSETTEGRSRRQLVRGGLHVWEVQ